MQVRGVVVLVEAVDDDLPVGRELPHELVVQLHVLHAVDAEVGGDLRADPVRQRRGDAGTAEHHPHPAGPLGALDRRRAQPVERLLVEVLTVRNADNGALEVVAPAVPATGEAPRCLPGLGNDAGAAMLAHVVEAADAAVPPAADDDRLALALPDDVVAGARDVIGSADDLPAAVENLAPLLLEPSRVRVHRRIQFRRSDIGDERHTWTDTRRQVTAMRDVDHRVSPR